MATSKLPQEIANRNKTNTAKNTERSAFGGPAMGKASRDKERLRATLADDSLQVREDPKKGFFVEGLSVCEIKAHSVVSYCAFMTSLWYRSLPTGIYRE